MHAYISAHWTGHLASVAVRLMQNTGRPGRWQLYQEVDPQQAKGTCARKSSPDTRRWSGGHWWPSGWWPRRGVRAGGSWKTGGDCWVRPPLLKGMKSFWFFLSLVFGVVLVDVVVISRSAAICSSRNCTWIIWRLMLVLCVLLLFIAHEKERNPHYEKNFWNIFKSFRFHHTTFEWAQIQL